MKRLVVGWAVLASAAWGDIPPSDTSGCRDKTEGAACKRDDGAEGSCGKATCSRNDYSNGPPPTSVAYECLKCGAVAAPPPSVQPVLNPPPATPAPEKKKQSCAAVPVEGLAALLTLLFLRRSNR